MKSTTKCERVFARDQKWCQLLSLLNSDSDSSDAIKAGNSAGSDASNLLSVSEDSEIKSGIEAPSSDDIFWFWLAAEKERGAVH